MIQIDNDFKNRCHEVADNLGWHKKMSSGAELVMSVIMELSDAVKAYLNDRHARKVEFIQYRNSIGWASIYNTCLADTLEDKLANTIIKCLDLAVNWCADIKDTNGYVKPFYQVTPYISPSFPEFVGSVIKEFNAGWYSADKCINDLIMSILSYSKENDIDILWYLEQRMIYNEHMAEFLNK